MLRSSLEFVAEAYAQMLVTTDRVVHLDVSRYTPKLRDWDGVRVLPKEVIEEFQRRRMVILYYVGGVAESIEPNATLHRPPLFGGGRDADWDVSFILEPHRADWKAAYDALDEITVRDNKRAHAYNKLSEEFWPRIKQDMREKHHRDILCGMFSRNVIRLHAPDLSMQFAFAGRMQEEMLKLWITPLEAKTWEDHLSGGPLVCSSKKRQQELLIDL